MQPNGTALSIDYSSAGGNNVGGIIVGGGVGGALRQPVGARVGHAAERFRLLHERLSLGPPVRGLLRNGPAL